MLGWLLFLCRFPCISKLKNIDLSECIARPRRSTKPPKVAGTTSTSDVTRRVAVIRMNVLNHTLQSAWNIATSENEVNFVDSLGTESDIRVRIKNAPERVTEHAGIEPTISRRKRNTAQQEQAQRDLQIAIEQTKQTQDNSPVDEASDQSSEQTSEEQLTSQTSLPREENVRSKGGQHENGERYPLDPEDEDIVLKTIRKAAETEQDPKTKADLWEEYYEYADKK